LIDLLAHDTKAIGEISRIAMRRDGTKDRNLLFDITFNFVVNDKEEAEIVSKCLPGATELFMRLESGDETSTVIRADPPTESVYLKLFNVGEDGSIDEAFDGMGEVRAIMFKASQAKTIMSTKIRLVSLDNAACGALCGCLGESVLLEVARAQQMLPLPVTDPLVLPEKVAEVFRVVTASKDEIHCFGKLVEEKRTKMILDDFGTRISVNHSDVVATVDVCVEGGELTKFLDAYEKKILKAGNSPTWEHLILALGQEYAEEGMSSNPSDPRPIKWQTIKSAVDFGVN